MGAEIERIVDRKPIRGRVHYLVVWRGFGEESNTWESRMDLVADGYSSVIREYENGRKDTDDELAESSASSAKAARSPSRGRSPGRGKSPAKSSAKSTSSSTAAAPRPRGRPRSNSATRSPSASRGRRSSSKSRDASDTESSTPTRRRSSRKQEKEVIEALEKTGDEELLRQALEALDHVVDTKSPTIESLLPAPRAASSPVGDNNKKKPVVTLSYESTETSHTTTTTTTSSGSSTADAIESPKKEKKTTESSGFQDLWARLNEGNWLLGFISVLVVAASLLASQLLPGAADHVSEPGVGPEVGEVEAFTSASSSGQWRQWLPFLTPLVALLLVFHQRDERMFVKWIAIALSWRIATELSLFFELGNVAIGAATVSYTALVVVLVLIARTDDMRSKSTLGAFVGGALMLTLSDSWIVETDIVALSSRVNLMSASALAMALSPRLTATADEE